MAVCSPSLDELEFMEKVTLKPLKRRLGLVAACRHWQVAVVILYLIPSIGALGKYSTLQYAGR